MNPQPVGQHGPPGGPGGWPAPGNGAPNNAAVLAPPAAQVPPPPGPGRLPVSRPRRQGWIAVGVMLTLAVLMALTAVVMSTIKLTAPAPTATTTTVMAPPPPPTSFSPDQLAAAKKEACHASESAATTINTAQEKYLIAARDRQSPTYGPALANFQLVAILETQYMQQHLPPATPNNVVDSTNGYITAILALADAHTRGLSEDEAQQFVVAARKAGRQLDEACV